MTNSTFAAGLKRRLLTEHNNHDHSGIYSLTQKMFAYNSNRIEGSTLTFEQTASLFDTGTIAANGEIVRAKDVEEMTGHFLMFSRMLQSVDDPLSTEVIKAYHYCLKAGVFEDMANGYPCGEYKNRRNIIGNIRTSDPQDVPEDIKELLNWYEDQLSGRITADRWREILAEFHVRYEKIHPFQDGNGRTGRIILFKECLRNDIEPFIIEDSKKAEYYRCLNMYRTAMDIAPLAELFDTEQKTYYNITKDMVMMM